MAGGAKLGGEEEEIISGINVTPLVVMVTASYIIAPHSIDYELPKAKSGGPTGVATLAIGLSRDGKLSLNGKPADEMMIRAYITKEIAAGRELQAVITADMHAYHGQVVQIIDLVRRLGVTKFAVSVDAT
jgi:biopolymer transport protein ExbD